MRTWLILGAALALIGCDDPSSGTDAGTDAGPGPTDGGMDAGADDAGGADAGPGDAGPGDAGPADASADAGPPSIMDLGDMAGTAAVALDAAIEAVPMAMRVDGSLLDLELTSAGIAALVGEDGLRSLALDDATVRAQADLHQTDALLAALQRAIDGLASRVEPEIVAVRDRAVGVQTQLTAYRDALRALFRERVGLFVGTPVVADGVFLNQELYATGTTNRIPEVVEGRTSGTPDTQVDVFCFVSLPIDMTIVNAETGATLGTASGMDSVSSTIAVPFDDVTLIEILVDVPGDPMGLYQNCGVSVNTRRRLRAAAVGIDGANMAYFDALLAFNGALSSAGMEAEILRVGTLDSGVVDTVVAHITRVTDLVAPFLSSDYLPIPVETYQRIQREAVYVRAMIAALTGSEALAPAAASTLRTALTDLMTAVDTMIAAVSP